jgi:hypothetical protein
MQNLLGTPIRDDSGKPNLLGIVSYVRSKAKDHTAKFSIRAFDNLVFFHIWLERLKNNLKTLMIELATKLLKFGALSLAFTCWITN